ncbi:hypothetical protein [Niveibacterium sp. COAC-50]|uniref:hypothetical protein n=1 Tax=Niveibacterium sp. COAC-50 TaxID=2729384 RepID=UPI001554AD76|nr:hypothetical protein [Niveibacterium sp. COAC-50]
MTLADKLKDAVEVLIKAAKDLPTEKIAVIGLIIIGAVAANRSGTVGTPDET